MSEPGDSRWKTYYRRHGLLHDPQIIAIMARDEKALFDFENEVSCRQKKKVLFAQRGEWANMARGDRESATFQKIDKLHLFASALQKSLKRKRDQVQQQRLPDPKFKNGQGLLQRWANWMKSAKEPPENYGKKKRPWWFWWFSGEVCSFKGYGTSRYAGVLECRLKTICIMSTDGMESTRWYLNDFLWRNLLTRRATIRMEGS